MGLKRYFDNKSDRLEKWLGKSNNIQTGTIDSEKKNIGKTLMPILCGDMSNRRTLKCIRGEDFAVFRRQEEIFQDQQHQLFRLQPSIAKSHESQNKTFQICNAIWLT